MTRALGQRERLIVAMAHQRDDGLVAADGREHVVGRERRRLALGLTQRGGGFVVAAGLREHRARERVHQREMAAVARRMQRGGRFGDVLADDRHVADLRVAERQLVVGAADGARVVGDLRLLERAAMQRDRARLLAAAVRDAAVQAPQGGQQDRRDRLANGVGRTPERRARLRQIAQQQQRFGDAAPHRELVVFFEGGLEERRRAARRRQGPVRARDARPRAP